MQNLKVQSMVFSCIAIIVYYLFNLTTLSGCKPHKPPTTTTTTSAISTSTIPAGTTSSVPASSTTSSYATTSVSTTTTSIQWYQAANLLRSSYGHASFELNNKMWLAGGYYSVGPYDHIAFSDNGSRWTQASGNISFNGGYLKCVAFDGKAWMLGGGTNGSKAVYSTATPDNMSSWHLETGDAPFLALRGNSCCVFKNKMWVIGGAVMYFESAWKHYFTNAVWSSSDGVNWTSENPTPSFTPRMDHTCVVFNNKLWVIGGVDNATGSYRMLNDVWYSEDGISWDQATPSADFSPRYWHSSVAFDNKMWVIGGFDNDTWYSSDGMNWEEVPLDPDMKGLLRNSSLVFDNKLWIFGGSDVADHANYRVWYTPGP